METLNAVFTNEGFSQPGRLVELAKLLSNK